MGLFSRDTKKLNWKPLKSPNEVNDILSSEHPTLIFKHSTRCAISSMALSQFEREWELEEYQCDLAFLDLIQHREASDFCEDKTGIVHQSPQAILIKNGEVLHHSSHQNINAKIIANILLNDEN